MASYNGAKEKNELMAVFESGLCAYFPTDAETCKDAMSEMLARMNEIGVNTDNLNVTELALRNGDYEDIDSWTQNA